MPDKKPAKRRKLSKAMQEKVDAVVREHKGKAAVEFILKASLNPKYPRYQIFVLSNGVVLYVNVDTLACHEMPTDSKLAKQAAKILRKQAAQ